MSAKKVFYLLGSAFLAVALCLAILGNFIGYNLFMILLFGGFGLLWLLAGAVLRRQA